MLKVDRSIMRRIVERLFEAIGFAIMAVGAAYAIVFVVGETIEHFTP